MAARQAAYKYPKEKMLPSLPEGHTVYGLIVDTPLELKTLISIAAFANGAANLYVNSGGGVVGAAQRYKRVAQAARGLVLNANSCLSLGEKTKSFDLPVAGFHFVYLLTTDGVYKIVMSEKLVAKDRQRAVLFNGYQSLIHELRYAQMKDRKLAQQAEENQEPTTEAAEENDN